MSIIENFIVNLQQYLCDNNSESTVIRIHTKKLEKLGDISFPLDIKSWHKLVKNNEQVTTKTIFEYNKPSKNVNEHLEDLKKASRLWPIEISHCSISEDNVNVFLDNRYLFIKKVIGEILNDTNHYGGNNTFHKKIVVKIESNITEDDLEETDLTGLRLFILKKISLNIIKCSTNKESTTTTEIMLSSKFLSSSCIKDQMMILCGPVLDENSQKSTLTASQLFSKRSSDMRMMAQHKYGIRFETKSSWKTYFETLGKASVTLEMLSSKPQKSIKIALSDLQVANKGSSFIFYNCARLNVLLEQFNRNVTSKIYPDLPLVQDVDFSLLNQPEEWEIFYVYIVQYPIVVKRCVKDIEKGVLNIHNLVIFLSNLASLFSSYYRRVKILIDPREHLFSVLYARIYLLKSLQYVFHHALALMDIEPIKEM